MRDDYDDEFEDDDDGGRGLVALLLMALALWALVLLLLRFSTWPVSVMAPAAKLVPVALRLPVVVTLSAAPSAAKAFKLPSVFNPAASVPLLSMLPALIFTFPAAATVPVLVKV